MCWVLQPRSSPPGVEHHSLLQDGMYEQVEDPAPNTREHWALESKYSPASLVTSEPASSRFFLGLFLRHDPNPALNTFRYN